MTTISSAGPTFEVTFDVPALDGDTAWARRWMLDYEIGELRAISRFRSLPWYRRAWLTLTGKAPR